MKWWKDLLFSCSLNNVQAQWVLNSSHSAAPSQQLQPSRASWEFFFLLLPFPFTLPSENCILGASSMPSLPMESSPRNHISCSIQKGRQACHSGSLSDLFFTSALETASQDCCKTSFAVTDWHEVTLWQPHLMDASGTRDFFCLTSGTALRLLWSWVCLVSGWVLRGERDL